jgi:hypothetical protein
MLPEIMEHGKPRAVVWFNCMTWTFDAEITAHRNGWLDYHGFVSNYQKGWLKPPLDQIRPVVELEGYRPYFNPNNVSQQVEFNYREPAGFFALGRISRDDGNKYSDDMWNIFYKVCTPRHKKVFILGYGTNAHARTGPAPGALNQGAPEVIDFMQKAQHLRGELNAVMRLQGTWCTGLDWQAWGPNEVAVKHVYNTLHCIIHKTGGSRESYCRIVPEAYAYGVPMIVEDDYAFPDLIQDGVTGFRCKSSDEMSFHASELAFDEEKRKKLIFAAREFLLNDIASPTKCWEPWKKMFEEQGMK